MSSGKKSIQVAIKVRPLLKKEKDKEQQSLWRVVDNSIQLTDSQADPIYFDHIFDQDASNQVIFDKVAKPIVHSAIEGFNGTIFAYGQTSSGKTYTMMGDDENPGVMVLAAKEIFRQIELTTERQFLLRIGYIEIYNEKIYDLLDKKNQDLKIHEVTNGLVSVNCEEFIITCEENFLQHLTDGTKERTVGETNMNERSSRSHAIFRIIIESRKMDRSEDDSVTQSVLNLVDLAGSERADQTGARGARLKEGGHINKSLLFLSNVIKRLSEDEDQYISYRDSKLTRILQASLGGNALTAIICTIKPTAVEETQSTLNFALRAKTIKTKPQVNETVSDATMMKRLEREIQVLKTRLEEEQRKNESQIQVRMLEQLIRKEDLKIISCNSLHSVRNREKRRRTWCPSSTNHDSSSSQLPSALPVPSLMFPPSRLQPPKSSNFLTPLITMKPTEPPSAPKSLGGLPMPEVQLPEIEEEFAPADMVNFELLSPLRTPPRPKSQYRVSITPKVTQNEKKNLEVVENELLELQKFTNLENKADIQHDTDWALKQIVESLTNRNAFLEKERLQYLEVKNEIHFTSDRLNKNEKRCDELQIQVTKLTCSNKIANDKISKYEHELAELKKTNEKLEMERREAVNLEFEFESHKNKSKLRENELLELLTDKQHELNKLEKSLKSISDEQLQNTKEELLQLSLSDSKSDANGKVCVKCEDLQRILEENRKVTQEFEKLTLEFQQLKLNFKELERENENSKAKVVELEDLQKSESVQCEKLQRELQELKNKLYDIQKKYEQVNLENSSKTEECMALNHQVELARQDMVMLQDKYNALELSWQKQQQTLKDIEYQYAEIESKYHHLQTEYKQLECCKGEAVIDCDRLQKDNVELQSQIDDLKHKVQDVQHQLLENAEKAENYHVATSKANEETSNVQKQNVQLKQQLLELQTQFEELQKEYDDLSNQLMDNLQESEMLKVQNTKLEVKLKDFEDKCAEVSKAESEMCDLKSQLEKLLSSERKSLLYTPSPCRNSSMRSSGVCIEEEEFDGSNDSDDLLKKFCQLSECLTQIELEHQNGKRRVFKTPTTAPTPNYKLYLRNISGVSKAQKDFVDEMEKIHLQGSFKQHSFHIVELNQSTENETEQSSEENYIEVKTNDCDKCSEYIDKLKEQLSNLKELNEQERQSNKSLLENTERTLSEMREQITQLSAELLEKSTFVENCACKSYQMQIECLEKEKADITLVCEELQEKVTNYTLDGSIMNLTLNGDMKMEKIDLSKELDLLRSKESELQETIESQTKMLEDLTQQNLDLESDLKTAQSALEIQEKNHKEKCNQLELEMLGKLEISANKHRDNMKKYNSEWEQGKVAYECTIKDLENQLKVLREESEKQSQRDRNNTFEIQEQLDMVRQEFNQLQTEHLELKQAMPKQIKNELTSSESIKELEKLKQEFDHLQTLHSQLEDDQNQKYKKLSTDLEDLKEKEIQLLKEKENLGSDLMKLRVDYKTVNEKYNSLVLEKESLFEEKENLQNKLCGLQEMLKGNEALQERIDLLVLEREQINMQRKQIVQKLQSTESRIEEYCTEDANREEIIKSLQSKILSLEVWEEEKLNLNCDRDKVQKELSDLRIQFQKLQEKQVLENTQSDSCETDETQQKDTEIQLQIIKGEKQLLEEKLIQHEMLHAQKASLEEQLKSFESIMNEKMMLEQKLNDFETLQEVNRVLEERNAILEEVNKENSNLEAKLKEIDTICQEHIKTLASLNEEKTSLEEILIDEKKASEEKLKEYDVIKQEKHDIEEQLQEKLRELDLVKQGKINIEEELKEKEMEIEVFQQESANLEAQLFNKTSENDKQTAALANLNDEKRLLEEVLNKEKEAFEEKLKELDAIQQEKLNELDVVKQEKISVEEQLKAKGGALDVLRQESANLEAQLLTKTEENEQQIRALSSLNEEKRLLEEMLHNEKKAFGEKLKEHDDIKQEKLNIEEKLQEKLMELDVIKQGKNGIEEQLKEKGMLLDALRQESENLKKHVHQTAQTLNDFKNKDIMSLNENESLKEIITTLTNSSASLELEKCNLDKELQKRNQELQLLRNKNETLQNQLTFLTEEKKSLFEQCSQLTEEKEILEEQLKCLGEKEKTEELLEQMISEKTELTHSLRLANEKLDSKQEELDKITQDYDKSTRDVEMLKCSLLSSSREKQQLEDQLEQYQQLSEDKSKLEATISYLKAVQANTLKTVLEEKESLQKTLAKCEHEISEYKQKEDTLNNKIESLSQQLHEMRGKADAYENLLVDHEELENALRAASTQNAELSNEITTLKSSITFTAQAQERIVLSQNDEIQKLELQLLQSTQHEQDLLSKHNDLQEKLQREQSTLQQKLHEFKASVAELQLKYDSLQATNTQLQTQNQILEQQVQRTSEQLKEAKSLQDELMDLKVKYDEIRRKMEATVEEAGNCSRALREDLQRKKQCLEKQLETYNTLRREMNTKESYYEQEKEKLTSTIKTLQTEKSSLEEKLREITVNNFKQDLHRQATDVSANTSIDTSTSSSSPRSRRSIESMNISVEDKLCTNHARGTQHTAERKNRRLSSFNERRQSYWGVTHDKATLTDPVDTSCNCVELDQKLQECEKKLFIRESQVTALNMELKNHPLKDQNAVLMKRLQEEQDKYRIEIKRYKQKLYEQTIKSEKALAVIAEQKSSKAESTSTSADALTPPTVVENAETQTDCDLSADLSTLQGKYNDLINICRYRKNVIKELEEKLSEKENSDGNSMSARDGQMMILKSQCESMKKELNVVNDKYQKAKLVLRTRREEINRLRSQQGQS